MEEQEGEPVLGARGRGEPLGACMRGVDREALGGLLQQLWVHGIPRERLKSADWQW